jgi:hypothetical protein
VGVLVRRGGGSMSCRELSRAQMGRHVTESIHVLLCTAVFELQWLESSS